MHSRFFIDQDIRPIKHCHTVAVWIEYIKSD